MAGETLRPAHVTVDSTVLWRTPQAPRAVDAAMLTSTPDHQAWLAAMDTHPVGSAAGRGGLLDRIETELNRGEPVQVLPTESPAGWVRVVCPWQPRRSDPRGYPGWVRAAHLTAGPTNLPAPDPAPLAVSAQTFLAAARRHLGLRYLWGGTTAAGLDCSGLVHHLARGFGFRVPRDGGDQHAASIDVDVDEVRPGDLYFFARPGDAIHHVGIVVEPGRMLHAPDSGAEVVEETLSAKRLATLTCAGRILA